MHLANNLVLPKKKEHHLCSIPYPKLLFPLCFFFFGYFALSSLPLSLFLSLPIILYRLDLPLSPLANIQTSQILLFNRQSCADQLCIFYLHALLCKSQNMYSHLFCHAVALLYIYIYMYVYMYILLNLFCFLLYKYNLLAVLLEQ